MLETMAKIQSGHVKEVPWASATEMSVERFALAYGFDQFEHLPMYRWCLEKSRGGHGPIFKTLRQLEDRE